MGTVTQLGLSILHCRHLRSHRGVLGSVKSGLFANQARDEWRLRGFFTIQYLLALQLYSVNLNDAGVNCKKVAVCLPDPVRFSFQTPENLNLENVPYWSSPLPYHVSTWHRECFKLESFSPSWKPLQVWWEGIGGWARSALHLGGRAWRLRHPTAQRCHCTWWLSACSALGTNQCHFLRSRCGCNDEPYERRMESIVTCGVRGGRQPWNGKSSHFSTYKHL